MKTNVIKTKSIFPNSFRFDPSFHLSEAIILGRDLDKVPYEKISIKDTNSKVFLGNIFSRIFVKDKEHGIPYLAASDTVLADLNTSRYLSNKQAKELNYLMLKKDWILITCSGTIGNVTYTNSTFENHIATHDLIRIVPDEGKIHKGYLYAFLSSKYGYNQLTQSRFGGVVKHINAEHVNNIFLPLFPNQLQKEIDNMIQESAKLREEATTMLAEAKSLLLKWNNLKELTTEDYEYYGPHSAPRKVSCFNRNIKNINTLSFHAFNHSSKIRNNILEELYKCKTITLYEALDDKKLWSPSGVEVTELKEGHGIMLINQSDIFNQIVKGKWVVKKQKYDSNLLQEDEILIAKIGTLGENESFCRCIYVGEELKGQLISSAFYRMSASKHIPSGYLYAWLSSEYGFRLIRSSQYGTKQCYPNTAMLYKYPVPIIDIEQMLIIDKLVKDSHHKQHLSNCLERRAIKLVEQEIEKWNKN